MARHFLSTLDHDSAELARLAAAALELKRRGRGAGRIPGAPDLAGRVLGLLFFNPSVRTRVSCESAMARLGGTSVALAAGSDTWRFEARPGAVMDGDTQEHVAELAPVLASMCDAVGIRKAELMTSGAQATSASASYAELARDEFLHAFARHSDVPVLNLESNAFHPCQGLADMATLQELLGAPRGERYVLTWAWHPKALPVATPHSQLLAAADLGMRVTLLRPEGYDLAPEVLAAARTRAEAAGGALEVTDDVEAAYAGARVVCAKSWGRLDAYGRPSEEARPAADLRARWIVDEAKLARGADPWFLHCLPIRRNVIATDGVLDAPRCAVVRQAENRLWTAAALLADRLGRA
ncbi:MAG: N-acetylornithine carbamoyltransferase [Planctomycetes bacterium]|nr:N-acetylornithine carbamoyltransferase [Planctomycetota bacterium]